MGVEGFKGYLLHNLPWKKAFLTKKISKVSSLFMDFNSLIHAAKGKVYYPGMTDNMMEEEKKELEKRREKLLKKSKKSLQDEHISTVIQMLDEVVKTFNPVDNLFIAVDGVVNSAKMTQQKGRRFLAGKRNKEDKLLIFDGNAITPGTEFMIKLDEALEKWFVENRSTLSTKVIYSSHLSPGEGEHKIFDYIRRGDYVKGEGMNIIYGLDNDLIILSVLSPMEDFYMYPEEKKQKEMIHVDKLREVIIERMEFPGCDKKLLIQDFCVVTTFLGNDFLHKFPNFLRLSKSFRFIFDIYSITKKHLTDENNNIIWLNYLNFLVVCDNFNSKRRGKYFTYINYYLETKKDETYTPYPEYENNVFSRDEGGLGFNMKQFSKEWYSKQFNPDMVQWDGEIVETYNTESIREMCINYLQMVQWVQYYYTKGHRYISDFMFYHYTYNPLMGSVITTLSKLINENKTGILRDVVRNKEEMKITPIHQLISVLPKNSNELLPKGFKRFYNKFLDINPESFKISKENTFKDFQAYAVLPSLNVPRIINEMEIEDKKTPKNLKEKEDLILYKKVETPRKEKKKRVKLDKRDLDYSVSLEELL